MRKQVIRFPLAQSGNRNIQKSWDSLLLGTLTGTVSKRPLLLVVLCILLASCHYQLGLPEPGEKEVVRRANTDPLYDVFSLEDGLRLLIDSIIRDQKKTAGVDRLS